jgi:hypothetical protein
MEGNNTVASWYNKLHSERAPFLERAYECSELTIPSLLPREGHTGSSDLPTPYQSLGARGVNNLAAKLLLALFPPNTPFFKLAVDDFTLEELTQQEGMRAQVEEGLNRIERAVQSEYEARAMNVSLFEALKHAIVVGNVVIYIAPSGELKVFHLGRFVVQRDTMGNVMKLIVKESVSMGSLPPETRAELIKNMTDEEVEQSLTANIDLYTCIKRNENGSWKVWQEAKNVVIESSKGEYPEGKSPWIVLRWTKIDGEHYGRGYIEEYLGDLKSLEGLSQAILEGSAAMAKLLFMVNPNGTTNKADIANAENGAVVDGNAADVTTLQANKFADFRVALEQSNKLEERLSFAFLLNSAVQRNGDRVTAEEIRYMAQELEDALGGIYSILSQELQLPMVSRIMLQMQKSKRLPALPKGVVRPVIVAGFASLGRGQDLSKLTQFVTLVAQLANLPPELNKDDIIKRIGTALGIDMKGIVKSAEQLQAEQQQAMQQQMALQAAGPMANAAGKMMEQGVSNAPQN